MEEYAWTNHLASVGRLPVAGLLRLLMLAPAPVGIGIKGLDGRYWIANQQIERLLCRHGEVLSGKSESDVLPADICQMLDNAERQLLAGQVSPALRLELSVNSRLSRCVWSKLPVLGPDNALAAIVSLVFDAALPQELDELQQTNHQLQLMVERLELLAGTDKLTGAWSRLRLEESIEREIDRLQRYGQPLSVMIIDVDFFKQINDRHGHDVGDNVLRQLASMLLNRLRKADSLTRWGGEEFVVLCPNTTRASAALLAERLRQDVATAEFATTGPLTISIGVAECQRGESWSQWFKRADEALYVAKEGGRNQVQLAPQQVDADAAARSPRADFVKLQWHPAYECGNELVDRGHRLLFDNANALLAAILSQCDPAEVDPLIDQLLADVVEHFSDEESVFFAATYPAASEHAAEHRELVTRALAFVDEYRKGRRWIGDLFQFLAYDVITIHMLGADRLFFPCLRATEEDGGKEQPALAQGRKTLRKRTGRLQ
ncbi:MAG TPA: diguanylate cyclase [Accumulibacter sp.]|nr:diguanylate cyclase [Accumulibacter sp.]